MTFCRSEQGGALGKVLGAAWCLSPTVGGGQDAGAGATRLARRSQHLKVPGVLSLSWWQTLGTGPRVWLQPLY